MLEFGKIFITIGILFVLIGLIMIFFRNIGLPKLPGDILIKKDGFTFYFPIITSIIISIILTIILNLFLKK